MRGNTHRSAERNGRVLRNGSSHNPARRIMAALVSVALSFTLAGATVAAYGNEGTTEETQQSPATAEPTEGASQPEQNEDQGQATPEVQQTPEPSTPEPAETPNAPSESQETPQPDGESAQRDEATTGNSETVPNGTESDSVSPSPENGDTAQGNDADDSSAASAESDDLLDAEVAPALGGRAQARATGPQVSKQITKNGDNKYTLNLSITGAQRQQSVDTPTDVVLCWMNHPA